METTTCLECETHWENGETCHDHFYQMLYWENEFPGHGVVHHLAVLCFHLQHPSLYSANGLEYAKDLLVRFVERREEPQDVRREMHSEVNAHNRSWKVTARPGDQGAYAKPVAWKMTAKDVTAAGAENYIESVRRWAQTMLESLRETGNL